MISSHAPMSQTLGPSLPEDAPPPYTPPVTAEASARLLHFQQQVREISSFIRASSRMHEAAQANPGARPSADSPATAAAAARARVQNVTDAIIAARPAPGTQAGQMQPSAASRPAPTRIANADTSILIKATTTIRGSRNTVNLSGFKIPVAAISVAAKEARAVLPQQKPVVVDMSIIIEGDDNQVTGDGAFENVDPQVAHASNKTANTGITETITEPSINAPTGDAARSQNDSNLTSPDEERSETSNSPSPGPSRRGRKRAAPSGGDQRENSGNRSVKPRRSR